MGSALDADPLRKGRLLLALAAVMLAAACVSAPKPERSAAALDPNSPVVRDVEAASSHPGPYPRFSDIPPIATDVRPSPAWRAAVAEQRATGLKTDREAADLPATLSDTEAYAQAARGRTAGHDSNTPPADARERTEAFAAAQRARATPPPPPQ